MSQDATYSSTASRAPRFKRYTLLALAKGSLNQWLEQVHAQDPFHDFARLRSQMDAAVIGSIENFFFLMQCRDPVRCPDLWPSVCLDDPSGKQRQWERQGDRARHQDNSCDEVESGCAVFTQVFQYSQNVSGADAQEAIDQVRRVYMRELVHFGLG